MVSFYSCIGWQIGKNLKLNLSLKIGVLIAGEIERGFFFAKRCVPATFRLAKKKFDEISTPGAAF